jgi:hypothetical protein
MKILRILILLSAFSLGAKAAEPEVYQGEPLGEALWDVMRGGGVLISHPKALASPMERTDVFRFRDGRILVIVSVSEKQGEPFTVKSLFTGAGDGSKLASANAVPLPSGEARKETSK